MARPLFVTTSVIVTVSPASTRAGDMAFAIASRGSTTVFKTSNEEIASAGSPGNVTLALLSSTVCSPTRP